MMFDECEYITTWGLVKRSLPDESKIIEKKNNIVYIYLQTIVLLDFIDNDFEKMISRIQSPLAVQCHNYSWS